MRVNINAFTAGEISPSLEGRTDLPALSRGCRLLRNFLPKTTGGAFRRPGQLYQWTVGNEARVPCILPFNFSDEDSFILELGHEYLRFGKDGALVQSGGSPYQVAAEWQEEDLFQIKFVQVNDIMWGAHRARSPFQLIRVADNNWTLANIQTLIAEGGAGTGGAWPPMLDENVTATTLAASVTTGNGTLTASAATFVAGHVGSLWEISHRRETAESELVLPLYPGATAVLNLTVVPTAGQTFSIGGVTYTWKAVTTVTGPYHILIGTMEECCANAAAAINGGAESMVAGVEYGVGTARHPDVSAEAAEVNDATSATGILTGNGTNSLCPFGTNVEIRVGALTYRFEEGAMAVVGTVYDVRKGATEKASLENLVKAINLTGTAGTHYAVGTIINPDVTASLTADNKITLTAKASGVAGNTIATTINDSGNAVEPLTFASATLTGGSATTTCKIIITARQLGTAANSITVSDTMTTDGWSTPTLTGGVFYDSESAGVTVLGEAKLWSYGSWGGTVYFEQQNAAGEWEVISQKTGRHDRQFSGETVNFTTPTVVRWRIINGTGRAASDADVPRFVIEAADVRIYGLVEITGVTSPTLAQITVRRTLFSTDATALWSEGAWSDYRGWPNGVAVHEQRLLFMGTANEPEKVWASATGDFLNFRRGTADGDSWSRVLAADESSRIVWGASLGGGLVIGKPSEEWLMVSGAGDQSITPTNANAKQQSDFGSEDIQPLKVAARLLFAQVGGRGILEYGFSWEQQSFEAVDLTELCQHLTIGKIKQIDFAKRPNDLVCIVTEDGKFLTMTYKRRAEGSVIAVAYHPTRGTVESCAVINGPNGFNDIYLAVKRTVAGTAHRFIEKLDSYNHLALENSGILYEAWKADKTTANWTAYMAERVKLTYLDSSVRVTVGSPATVFSGFGHLEGETVNVQADGSWHAPVTVEAGTITLSRSASAVLAGLPYLSQVQSMPFDVQAQDGTSQGKKWRLSNLALRLYLTAGGHYADSPTGATRHELVIRSSVDEVNAPVVLNSGIKKLVVTASYQDSVTVWVGTEGNEPLNLLCVIPEFSLHST